MHPAKSATYSFGKADHGIRWAVSQLPGGAWKNGHISARGVDIELAPLAKANGEDDYAVKFGGRQVKVLANSAVGTISALLKLGEMLRAGKRKDCAQQLRFRTRNYKHELNLGRKDSPRYICNYTDELWEKLCQQIVSHQFNGLVFYPGYHPFEYILDYKECPEAASRPAAERAAVRKALNRGLDMAHRYGLKTFMQHYVNHFTRELAEAHGIPCTGRLSAVDHPAVEKYCRYCYREIFKQAPDLDGLYFNFESTPSASQHVLKTAVTEGNKMKRKPILVFRLWGFTDPDGMRQVMRTYKGRIILGHKISDTSDVYYLPVADSRVMEWKKLLGQQIEWMFLVGPCHNCGTNLCGQLWSDYDFVQQLLADARKKGADSFSFHTVNEFFAPEADKKSVFSEHEKHMARFNTLHMLAVADFVNNRARSAHERAAALAARVNVAPAAGRVLLETIETSSQLVLLAYQQFCYTSALDGYLNRGRYSHIQDPFFYYPVTETNNQSTRLLWRGFIGAAWVQKTIATKNAPDGMYQYIIDYVDPAKPKAGLNPQKIAELLRQNIDRSLAGLQKYRKLAGKAKAGALEPYLRDNAAFGEYVCREIRVAIELYSLYFARDKQSVINALRRGLDELRALPPLVADTNSRTYKSMARVAMFDRVDPKPEIDETEEALRLIESTDFPMEAFSAYLASRRLYNEVRRVVRPLRWHDKPVQAYVVKQLAQASAKAREALALLSEYPALAENVRAWLEFVESEHSRATPPALVCARKPSGEFLPLVHEHSFRAGENFVEDFTGFFKCVDYLRPVDQSFRVWHTPKELVVQYRERGIDINQRKEQWEKYKDEGSCSYVTQVHLDVDGKGERGTHYIVWPMAASVSKNREPHVKARAEFECDATSHQTTVWLPFALLGKKPRAGDVWGFNMACNPAVARNVCYTWAATWDSFNPRRFGRLRFE